MILLCQLVINYVFTVCRLAFQTASHRNLFLSTKLLRTNVKTIRNCSSSAFHEKGPFTTDQNSRQHHSYRNDYSDPKNETSNVKNFLKLAIGTVLGTGLIFWYNDPVFGEYRFSSNMCCITIVCLHIIFIFCHFPLLICHLAH